MKADPLTECPQCKGALERLIGAGAGIVFKGSGFYVTDYRKPDAKAAKAQPAQSPASESSQESPKESSLVKEPAPATTAPTASSPTNPASPPTTTS